MTARPVVRATISQTRGGYRTKVEADSWDKPYGQNTFATLNAAVLNVAQVLRVLADEQTNPAPAPTKPPTGMSP